jgi:hypothetical protein
MTRYLKSETRRRQGYSCSLGVFLFRYTLRSVSFERLRRGLFYVPLLTEVCQLNFFILALEVKAALFVLSSSFDGGSSAFPPL